MDCGFFSGEIFEAIEEISRAEYIIKVRIETEGLIFKRMVYDYFCYCTNMTIGAYQGHKFYGNRGTCENWIEAVKNQMFAGMIVTQNFWLMISCGI